MEAWIREKRLEDQEGRGNAQTVESCSAVYSRWSFMLEFTHSGPRKEVVAKRKAAVVIEEWGWEEEVVVKGDKNLSYTVVDPSKWKN